MTTGGTGPFARFIFWRPDPAVPLPAHLLAWAFGGAVLLAVVLTLLIRHPPDETPYPHRWMTYTTPNAVSIPYPEGWKISSSAIEHGVSVIIELVPDSPVRLEFIEIAVPGNPDSLDLPALEQQLEADLHKRFPTLAPRAPDVEDRKLAGLHPFAIRLDDEQRTPISGGWLLRYERGHILYLTAFSPPSGWSTMAEILRYMSREIT